MLALITKEIKSKSFCKISHNMVEPAVDNCVLPFERATFKTILGKSCISLVSHVNIQNMTASEKAGI